MPHQQNRGRGRGHFRGQYGAKSEKRGNDQQASANVEKKAKETEEKEIIYMPVQNTIKINEDPSSILMICFDIETAEGSELSEIYQMGAISSLEDKLLVNMLPQGKIHWGVTKYAGTNVTIEVKDGQRHLWHTKNKEIIPSVSPKEGWKTFMSWVQELKKRHPETEKIIWASHGSLDAPCLLNNLKHYGHLEAFLQMTDGFCDTMPILNNRLVVAFERLYPDEEFEAHNALGDAEALFKILYKRSHYPNSNRILFNEELKNSSVGSSDALAFSQFRVSKLAQSMTPPNGVYQIKSLVNFNLSKVTFKNQTKQLLQSDVQLVPLTEIQLDLTVILIDIQLMHSQGERSEIVQIAAQSLQKDHLKFEANCHGFNEDFLANDVRYLPVSEALKNFVKWLEKNFPNKFIVLTAFKIFHKIWPSFIYHAYFHDVSQALLKQIQGVCDLKKVIMKEDKVLGKRDNIDTIHIHLFNEKIDSYKSKEVLDSTHRIIKNLQKPGNKSYLDLFQDCVEDPKSTLAATKVKLDKSLGEDISRGKHYPLGHIGNYRLPENYMQLT